MIDALYHDYMGDDTVNIKEEKLSVDFMKMAQGDMVIQMSDTPVEKPAKRKRSTKAADPNKVVKVGEEKQSNGLEPYSQKYKETNDMLRSVIIQSDMGLNAINSDIEYIRSSKTMKSKYNYLGVLQGNASAMIGNKIAAIREMNNSISKAEDFELKRAKDLKLNETVDDDRAIQEMYKAFVTASNPNPYAQLGPSTYDMTVNAGMVKPVALLSQDDENAAYNNYLQNMTPQQHMIALENDPNVKQVVLWNKTTGAKSFEIMNMATGEILQNVDKRDIMFMDDTTIDPINNVARNLKLNETYPLVTIGESHIDEY